MSIGAIGGLTAASSAVSALAKPEAQEVRGAPDNDMDADNSSAKAPVRTAAVGAANGNADPVRVDVKA